MLMRKAQLKKVRMAASTKNGSTFFVLCLTMECSAIL